MPRSLFLKIFLWFGAAMITLVVVTSITNELARPDLMRQPMVEASDRAVSGYAQTAAEHFERGGSREVSEYLNELERTVRMRGFLFSPQLEELSGRRIPVEAPNLVRRVLGTRRPELGTEGLPPLLAAPAQTSSGNEYVLVMELPRRQPPPFSSHMLHLLPVLFIGAAFCYGLARYLTAPLAKLRVATNELARGNLAARVGPPSGSRRDELVSLGSDFDQMAEQIESLVLAQRRLLGDISHELRSPLARLNVALELARQRSGAEASSALARIQREAENLNEMIGELLTLTRLETGAQEIRREELDLAPLLREIADDADYEARSRDRSVRLQVLESCTTIGNEHLLRRAIENVVRNAVQHTADDTVVEVLMEATSNVQSPKTQVHSPQTEAVGFAEIVVRDHGPGVPEAALVEIFRPFYRVDDARDRAAGGVGLGLAIAERAIRIHGGTVSAVNAPEGGLVVTINLPLSYVAREALQGRHSVPAPLGEY
ncbi:MAG: ATP-binding protein [bacterium]